MKRDYAAEMRRVIDAETSDERYTSVRVAEQIVEKLKATDPDLLNGWLNEGAVQFLRQAINLRDSAVRTHARIVSNRKAFGEAARKFQGGDPAAMSDWLGTRYVVEDGSRVRLGDMRSKDLTYVADRYTSRAKDNALQAAFLRALAKKVGSDTVHEHYNDEQLNRMWASLSGEDE